MTAPKPPAAPSAVAHTTAVILLTGLNKAIAMLRDIVMASMFGASGETDIFVLAFTLVTVLLYASGIDMLRGISASIFARLSAQKGMHRLSMLFSSVLNWGSLYAVLLILLGIWQMPLIIAKIAPGLPADSAARAVTLGRVLIAVFYLLGMGNYFAASLNVLKRYYFPVISLIFANTCTLLSLWIWGEKYGIVALGYGFLAGFVLSFSLQFICIQRAGIRFRVRQWQINTDTRGFLKSMTPLFLLTIITQICVLVERSLAIGLAEGSLSALSFANKLNRLSIELCVVPFASVFLPLLSRYLAKKQLGAYREQVYQSLRFLLVLLLPITLIFLILPSEVVTLVYERGAFVASDRQQTATALRWYAMGLLPLGFVHLSLYIFLANQRTRLIALAGSTGYLLNLALLYYLIPRFDYIGVCIATNLGAVVYLSLLVSFYHLRIRAIDWSGVARTLLPILGAGLVFSAALLAGTALPGDFNPVMCFAATVASAAVLYLFTLRAAGVPEISDLIARISGSLRNTNKE